MGCSQSTQTSGGTKSTGGDSQSPLPQERVLPKNKNKRNVPAPSVTTDSLNHPPPQPQVRERNPIVTPDDPLFEPGTNTRNKYDVDEVYDDLNQELGKGTFGDVYKGAHKLRNKTKGKKQWHNVAIKKTAPTILDYRDGGRIRNTLDVESRCQEIRTLLKLRDGTVPQISPVLYLYEYYWDYNKTTGKGEIFLVTELLGQELDQWRQQQQVFMESSAKKIAMVLLDALDFMHSRNIVHRDIKLQNVLFRKNNDFRTLKIVDFGLAKELSGDRKAKDFCGSLGYIAPEIYLTEPYTYEVDMFAFGVILFRLLSGARPFASSNNEKLRNDTINLRYTVQGKNWEGITPEALKLVRKLLIGREQRLTAEDALQHEWFSTQGESILHYDYSQSKDYVPEESYSRAIALSHAPSAPSANKDGNRFWLETTVSQAIKVLLSRELYMGRIVQSDESNTDELICLEEIQSTTAKVLPIHIARLNNYTEKECRRICREIAQIIKLMHDHGMAHRNIHMNNFMVEKKGNLVVRGLQYAQAVEEDQPLTGHFGYLYSWYAFKAPEIDSDFFHDKSVDLWSLGAMIYMLLTALPPFRGDGADLITNKHAGNVEFDMVVPSGPAQQLVRGLLQVNPANRLTIEEVLNSEWMIEADDRLAKHDLSLAQMFMQDWEQRPVQG